MPDPKKLDESIDAFARSIKVPDWTERLTAEERAHYNAAMGASLHLLRTIATLRALVEEKDAALEWVRLTYIPEIDKEKALAGADRLLAWTQSLGYTHPRDAVAREIRAALALTEASMREKTEEKP